MIDRRAFLRRLGFGTIAAAAAATGAIDIERLLWMPGEKTIVLPAAPTIATLSENLNIGDVITFAGRYAVNPRTGKTTEFLQQFVITADSSSGTILTARHVHPPMISDDPYRNISASVADKNGRIDGRDVQPLYVGRTIPTISTWVNA